MVVAVAAMVLHRQLTTSINNTARNPVVSFQKYGGKKYKNCAIWSWRRPFYPLFANLCALFIFIVVTNSTQSSVSWSRTIEIITLDFRHLPPFRSLPLSVVEDRLMMIRSFEFLRVFFPARLLACLYFARNLETWCNELLCAQGWKEGWTMESFQSFTIDH